MKRIWIVEESGRMLGNGPKVPDSIMALDKHVTGTYYATHQHYFVNLMLRAKGSVAEEVGADWIRIR